jgi:hypothetical protein
MDNMLSCLKRMLGKRQLRGERRYRTLSKPKTHGTKEFMVVFLQYDKIFNRVDICSIEKSTELLACK